MNIRYVDAHCHLQFEQFEHDEAQIVEKMRVNGVAGIMVGVDAVSSEEAVALSEKYDFLYSSVGLHPSRAGHEYFDESAYRTLAKHPRVVAIGECGLDYYRLKQAPPESPLLGGATQGSGESFAYYRPADVTEEIKRVQKEVLQYHIELAGSIDKPLIIHCRPSKGTQDAYLDLITILKDAKQRYPRLRGDIHFFVGGISEAEAFFALDFSVSFTAVITFARDYDAVIQAAPLQNILIETDSPYVAPLARRGERNDPLAVIDVADQIATIRGEDPEVVRQALLLNAQSLFSLPPETDSHL